VKTLWLVLALGASACALDNRASRDRGATGWFENVPRYPAPLESRCAKIKSPTPKKNCEEAMYLGQIYVRRLGSGEEICLEGGFGERSTAACLCRAAVVDTNTNVVLVEVREAKPDSRWFKKESNQFWFEEGALVDLYLADHGY